MITSKDIANAKWNQENAATYFRQSCLSKEIGQTADAIKYQKESAKQAAAARRLMGIEVQATMEKGIRFQTQLGCRSSAKHLYDIESVNPRGRLETIEVFANTRTQAASIATKAGYAVRSVNMTG